MLFFNSGQHIAHSAIVDSIETFGEPFIENDGERLAVKVGKLDEVQTLFAFDGDKFIGLLVYSRVSHERLVVIHIAVHEDYSSTGDFAGTKLVLRLCQQLRRCARSIKGIESIRMMYGNNRTRDYTVKKLVPRQFRPVPGRSESTLSL